MFKVRRGKGGSVSLRALIAPYVSAQRGRLTLMSITAILGGFSEAAVLVLIARIAFADLQERRRLVEPGSVRLESVPSMH